MILQDYLQNQSLLYVTRDIERALGMEPNKNYRIITNDGLYSRKVKEQFPEFVTLVSAAKPLDTLELLARPEAEDVISKTDAAVIVFKNTVRIEKICAERKWNLLNPSAELAERIENKITQVEWLGDQKDLLPPHRVTLGENCEWGSLKSIVQYAHSHTGTGTIMLDNAQTAENIRKTFPKREVRITSFIDGPVFTNNNVVTSDDILVGSISYQITGLPPFTQNKFSTIGNDWGLGKKLLNESRKQEYTNIAKKVGSRMKKSGWVGLFGIDVVLDSGSGKLHLLEINARQPASSTYESQLQKKNSPDSPSIFEAHLLSLLKLETRPNVPEYIRYGRANNLKLITIENGSQIVNRAKDTLLKKNSVACLEESGLHVIQYENDKPGSDLLRIQSSDSIMEDHGKLGPLGIKIARCIDG